MNTPSLRLLAPILFLALLGGCGPSEKAGEQTAIKPAAKKSAEPEEKRLVLNADELRKAGIRTEAIEPQQKSERIALTATIQPNQDRIARVLPRVPGRITRVSANLGDAVKGGQTLAVLESIDVGEARSMHAQARSEAALAQANFERAKQLFAENIVPQKDYLKARFDLERAQAVLRAAGEKLEMLGVGSSDGVGAAYPLVAPFAGTVIEKKAVFGGLAQADQSLFIVADLSTLWVEADLFEKDLAKAKPGARASVTVAGYPGEVFRGRLTYLSGTMDTTTRTVKVRVEVANADRRLKPGMFANVAIDTGTTVTALLLPVDAVLLLQGQATVFVADREGFAPRAVQTGATLDGSIVVTSGLEPGEKVAVSGAYSLKARLLRSQMSEKD